MKHSLIQEAERERWCVNHTQKQRKERHSNHFILMSFKETFNIDTATNNLYTSSLCEWCKPSPQNLNVTNHNIPPHSAPHVTEVTFCTLRYRCAGQKSHTCQQTRLNICITMTQKLRNIYDTLIDGNEIHFTRLYCNRGCWVHSSYF